MMVPAVATSENMKSTGFTLATTSFSRKADLILTPALSQLQDASDEL